MNENWPFAVASQTVARSLVVGNAIVNIAAALEASKRAFSEWCLEFFMMMMKRRVGGKLSGEI